MEKKTIAPIETFYKGYRFRSRLEARWAVFFDSIGIKYEYEPEGYVLPNGSCYLPDFKLYGVGGRNSDFDYLWVEVKGVLTREDLDKVENFSCPSGNGVIEEPVFIVGDIPYAPTIRYLQEYVADVHGDRSKGQQWGLGDHYYNLENVDGDYFWGFFVRLQNGSVVLEDENCNGRDMDNWVYNENRTLQSYARARQARFEHGETPQY